MRRESPADAKGDSPLMLASYNGQAGTTRALFDYGAEVDRRNDHGQTPFGGAAFKGHEVIVALLLEHGVDIDAINGVGMTPIMFAAMFGRVKVVERPRLHGASLNRRNCLRIPAKWIVKVSQLLARSFSRTVSKRPG